MNKSNKSRNAYMLQGPLATKGYDWWWHSFTGVNRTTGKEKAFFIEYFIINPELSSDKVIHGQKPNRTEVIRPSYVMINCGTWGENPRQLHNFYPVSQAKLNCQYLDVKVADCELTETYMKGHVDISEEDAIAHPEYLSDAGSMSWDLSINKQVAFHVGYGASKLFRTLNSFEMFWHAEGMKTKYNGTVTLDGEIYDVTPDTCYGYADKNWGSDFTSPWVWLSSNHIVSRITGKKLNNSVFDLGGGRPKVFGFALNRKLLGSFYYEGKDYEYNFSKPWLFSSIKFNCKETETHIIWRIHAENYHSVMNLECHCKKDEMLHINYEAPDGYKRHNKLWNGGTAYGRIKLYQKHRGGLKLIDDMNFYHAGCEYGEYDK